MFSEKLKEEELKNRIGEMYFAEFDYKKIIGNVDFCVSFSENQSLLWSEAKKGSSDIFKSLVQLILTVGKARIFDKFLPPSFLGAFDAEKMAFIPYNEIHDVFYWNDFNWNVAPSNHLTKEFKILHEKVQSIIEEKSLLFYYENDDIELKKFISVNFIVGKVGLTKIKIDKNNFISVYGKWLQSVKPTVAAKWDIVKKNGLLDGDFYLADLLSLENETLKEKLFVLLKRDFYELDRKIDDWGMFNSRKTTFTDGQKAHTQFWNRYERPPKKEFWDYIVERRDLLVPQDIRERKGSFFTPQIWVETAQKYLADVLGEDWQDEYYIWDCAAGTGNLLNGLTNKFHIWASTLDKQDVDVMQDRIANGANLLEEHVFQFDFLNDSFEKQSEKGKIPDNLFNIINDHEERKKLIIFINPPYAEAGSVTVSERRKSKIKVATETKIWKTYHEKLGLGIRELYAQFFVRISQEFPECILASFSTMKYVSGDAFSHFRAVFKADFKKGFVVPADTFDNVQGKFPIGFLIWSLNTKQNFSEILTDAYDKTGIMFSQKKFFSYEKSARITEWIKLYGVKNKTKVIGYTGNNGPDFQNNNYCHISSVQKMNKNGTLNNATKYAVSQSNLIPIAVYFAVRHCISATWLNDRDQFLFPKKDWENDTEFQNDCLAFTLFHGQNKISCKSEINHFIPFSEQEINARRKFDSNFMTQFIKGKLKASSNGTLLEAEKVRTTALEFSPEASAVFDSGRELWKYYHAQKDINVNASLYDIREFFQGRGEGGKMKNSSEDEKYLKLLADLRKKLMILAQKIEPKVYEHGFLKP